MGFIRESRVTVHGQDFFVAEAGEAGKPLLVLLHGFPETWASWRFQMPVLAEAGYHVIAPELRGYGESWAPEAVENYSMKALAADVTGLITVYGHTDAVLVGHDFGCVLAWQVARMHPQYVRAVVGLSVPYGGPQRDKPTDAMKRHFGDHFFYILYFQQEGVAEQELEANIRDSLRKIYYSGSARGQQAGGQGFLLDNPAGKPHGQTGFLTAMKVPDEPLEWLREIDLDYYVSRFEKSGFRGPLNWYRAMDLFWMQTRDDSDWHIRCPSLFIAGKQDEVITINAKALKRMPDYLDNLYGIHLLDHCGHWTQMEQASKVSSLLLRFLEKLEQEKHA